MKYLSLFSGIGGFEYALASINRSSNAREQVSSASYATARKGLVAQARQATRNSLEWASWSVANQPQSRAFTCVGYSEIDRHAIAVYHRHFPGHTNFGDITKIDPAGLPDFDLIVGGFPCQAFSIAGKRRGFNDTRGTLFFEIARIIKEKQPRLLLLENVKGLLSHDQGRTFLTIITTLDELGYDCQWQVLNSKNHGVPQNRERVFIIGHRRGTPRPQIFPFGNGREGYFEKQLSRKKTSKSYGVQFNLKNWRGYPLPRLRRLTPVECERLQGFPDGWTEGLSDTQRYKCLGNAVTTNVIKAIAERLAVVTTV